MAGHGRNVRGKGLVALGLVAGIVVGVLLAVGLLGRGGGGAQAAGEIYLAPASSTGPNPFTASLMTPAAVGVPPTPTAAPPEAPAAAPPDAGAATPPLAAAAGGASPSTAVAPATALASVDGSVAQLYGGRMGVSPCDGRRLVRFLDGDGEVARAWAVAAGLDADALHDFIDGLVPADVLDDVRVTDWHRVDGRGVAFQVVLQRGTTVLVDRFGVPRVRCVSGDPLTLPDRVQRTARFVGEAWEQFRPATLIVIVPAPRALPTLVLLETGSGQPFGRPLGGGRPDIDPDTLVADQARLGVVVSLAPPRSADAVQEMRLSPAGGPPGSTVLAFGSGWPAGDRIRIEPCVGGRPETCALRTDVAVFALVDPDGTFRAIALTVPRDVRLSDYVEFYVQDLHDGHRERSFDSPWRVAGAECRSDCGDAPGCHPPFCDPGDHHGCRCLVRTDPVCQLDRCDQCPRDLCAERLREEPTPSPRTSTSTSSSRAGGGSGQPTRAFGGVQTTGQGTPAPRSTTTSSQGGETTRTQTTTAQGTRTQTTTTTSTQAARSSAQTTQTTQSTTGHPPPPPPPTQSSTQTTRSQTTTQSSAPTSSHAPAQTQTQTQTQAQTQTTSTGHAPPPHATPTASPQPGH